MIDATDNIRFAVVKNELELLIKAKGIKGREVPILFFANKMDRPEAFSHIDIAKELDLVHLITDRDWEIR